MQPARRRDQFAVVDDTARSRLVALFRELDCNVDGLITIDDLQDALLLSEDPTSPSAPRVGRSQRMASELKGGSPASLVRNTTLARRAST